MEKKELPLGIIAIVIGVSGLGLSTYALVKSQVVEGPPGLDGTDGVDGTLDNLVAIWESASQLWGSIYYLSCSIRKHDPT